MNPRVHNLFKVDLYTDYLEREVKYMTQNQDKRGFGNQEEEDKKKNQGNQTGQNTTPTNK
jgi:hypothetical protein